MSPFSPGHSPCHTPHWLSIQTLAHRVEAQLQAAEVRLTMGGEPTFVSAQDFESAQWRTEALGEEKRYLAAQLLHHLEEGFSPSGALLHHGLGKLYPGEMEPRWALGCYWREDGVPLWRNPNLRATPGQDQSPDQETVWQWTRTLVQQLGLHPAGMQPVYDRPTHQWAGYVIPILPIQRGSQVVWRTCRWHQTSGQSDITLLPGNSQIGLRLPLIEIEWLEPLEEEAIAPLSAPPIQAPDTPEASPPNSICIALSLEIRDGVLQVFLPPLASARSFVDLLTAIETTAEATQIPVLIAGYPPPMNVGISGFQITPDPGVLEVNIHPAATWDDLSHQTTVLYAAAQHCGLGTEKYSLEGNRLSTGGGAHITLGGKTPNDSPFHRRPDLLPSMIRYWQNHPSLSYIFSGLFVGTTSQAPRLDEARPETLDELEVALEILQHQGDRAPELVDFLLGNLLVDMTGNAHRTELCIDKLHPHQNPGLQLGLLELRGFAMPTDASLRLLQLLLVRALVAWFWQTPYTEPLTRWGRVLRDRFHLPHYLQQDLCTVLNDLKQAGFAFDPAWFEPFCHFRFPIFGTVHLTDSRQQPVSLELRQAIEPWPVISDDIHSGGTSRQVDQSMERLQVTLRGAASGESCPYQVLCQQCYLPLQATAVPGEWVAGVRFRARQLRAIAHPAAAPHAPLVFDVVERASGRSLGGCTYYATCPHPKGYNYLPTHAIDAKHRVAERFIPHPPRGEQLEGKAIAPDSSHPHTLDLRRMGFQPTMTHSK